MHSQIPRLHMGCGESLRSHWLQGLAQAGRKPLVVAHKSKPAKAKRGRTRG